MEHQINETYKTQPLSFELALQIVNEAVLSHKNRHLKNIEVEVLRGAWLGYKYDQIATEVGYAIEYIKHDVGPKLWQIISASLGEKVSKNNLMAVLARQISLGAGKSSISDLKIPSSVLPLDSDFYIERSSIESRCYEEIVKPGAWIRIGAPNKMGKTSLMLRTLAHAKLENSNSEDNNEIRTITLSFQRADKATFSNLDKFLRWLCAVVTRKLKLPQRVDDYWCDDLGSKNNCTAYFEDYLLPEINAPLALALDKVDEIFSHPEIAEDFFSLLHSWHEEAAYGDNGNPIWRNLRLIIAHSTEVYISQNIHQFRNIGLEIELKPFTQEQVVDLANRYKLQLSQSQLQVWMSPY
ncbi:MAG: AAA-like domain-containing protein [Cyanobacteria bacterium J06632_19]